VHWRVRSPSATGSPHKVGAVARGPIVTDAPAAGKLEERATPPVGGSLPSATDAAVWDLRRPGAEQVGVPRHWAGERMDMDHAIPAYIDNLDNSLGLRIAADDEGPGDDPSGVGDLTEERPRQAGVVLGGEVGPCSSGAAKTETPLPVACRETCPSSRISPRSPLTTVLDSSRHTGKFNGDGGAAPDLGRVSRRHVG
jgi:hypothetical protein